MRLVIEIPNKVYLEIMGDCLSLDGKKAMYEGIKNGTPLLDSPITGKITGCAPEDEVAKSFIEDVEAVKDLLPPNSPICEYWDGRVCTGFDEAICKYQDYDVRAFWEGVPCKIGCRKHGQD